MSTSQNDIMPQRDTDGAQQEHLDEIYLRFVLTDYRKRARMSAHEQRIYNGRADQILERFGTDLRMEP